MKLFSLIVCTIVALLSLASIGLVTVAGGLAIYDNYHNATPLFAVAAALPVLFFFVGVYCDTKTD